MQRYNTKNEIGSMGPLLSIMMVCAAALLPGCAVGPDFRRPAPPAVERYTAEPLPAETASVKAPGGAPQRFIQEMDIPGQWWTLFRSEELNDLIRQALEANPDVRAAQAALRSARETVAAQQGAFFPAIEAGFNPTRQKTPGALSSPLASGDSIYSLHTAQVSVAYSPDLFGGMRRQVESLRAEAAWQRYQLEATYLTLTTNVVLAAIGEAGLRGQIGAVRRIIEIQKESLEMMRKQYTLGQLAEADVIAQEAALAQSEAAIPPLEKQLLQQRDLLARLVGRFPDETIHAAFELSSLHLPDELPVSLPSRLVAQRPDIRAAEEQLHAASAQVGVSIANRLPGITLSGELGSTATSMHGLFAPGSGFWGLSANITQPVFQGGTLLHRQRAAEAVYDQQVAQYRSTVLSAFQNVADSLHAIRSDAEAMKAAVAAERAAARNLEIVRRRIELGDASHLALLNAQQSYQQALINLIQAHANRFSDTVALFQALGGGWWNRSELSSE